MLGKKIAFSSEVKFAIFVKCYEIRIQVEVEELGQRP
jgi:hypothetical protein